MKIKQMLSVLTLGVFLCSSPIQAGTLSIPAVVTTDLNVRQYPNKNAKIIDVLPQGATVEAMDSGNSDWNKIDFGDYVGYVYNAYLAPQDDPIPLNARQASGMSPVATAQEETVTTPKQVEVERLYEPDEFKYLGVLDFNGWRWTWYSSHVYNNDLGIPGQHETSEGYIVDEDEYICLASTDLSKGTIIKTPLGYFGKVYDTGCPSGILDVYTNWSVY